MDKSPTMLLVDDNADNLFVLEQIILEILPQCKILKASSAPAGLALASTESIDGALIDVQMPKTGGIEMCKLLKADPNTACIPIILITAHRAPLELRVQGLEAGADDFIARPVDNMELAARIRVMLRIKRGEDELRQKQLRLSLIGSIAIRIKMDLSVDEIVEHTVSQISRSFPGFRVSYAKIDKNNRLTVLHSKGPQNMPSLSGLSANLMSTPEYMKALQEGKPICADDVNNDPRLVEFADKLAAGESRAALDVPIRLFKKIVGLLCLDSSKPRKWNQHEIITLVELSNYLSVVLKDAHTRKQRLLAEEKVKKINAELEELVEQRTAELRESEKKLRLIAENSSDAILAYDMDQKLLYVNPAIKKLMGYTVEETRDRPFIDWLHPDDRERMQIAWEKLFKGENFEGEEFRIIEKNGHVKWCSGSWGPLYDEEGNQIGVQGRDKDITQRKQLEQQREMLITDLREALSEVKTLSGLLPICASCKKVRDDSGYWNQIEEYIRTRLDLDFTHGICPDCMKELYPKYCKG